MMSTRNTRAGNDTNLSAQNQSGFTLIEVMVALAILAMVAVAASQVSQTYIQSTINLKLRTLAHFVAQNTATDLQISGEPINRVDERQVEMAGQSWQVILTPSALSIQSQLDATTMGSMSRHSGNDAIQLMIQVAPIREDGSVGNTLTDLTVVVANSDNSDMGNSMMSGLGGMN